MSRNTLMQINPHDLGAEYGTIGDAIKRILEHDRKIMENCGECKSYELDDKSVSKMVDKAEGRTVKIKGFNCL